MKLYILNNVMYVVNFMLARLNLNNNNIQCDYEKENSNATNSCEFKTSVCYK